MCAIKYSFIRLLQFLSEGKVRLYKLSTLPLCVRKGALEFAKTLRIWRSPISFALFLTQRGII